jgi:hypothetical protein
MAHRPEKHYHHVLPQPSSLPNLPYFVHHDFSTIITATETNGERVAITQILIDPRLPSNTKPS